MKILQLNKYITLNGGSESVMQSLHTILTSHGHSVWNMGFHKEHQQILPNALDLGPEKLTLKGLFKNKPLIQKVLEEIKRHNIECIICHNLYHHFPVSELFRSIRKHSEAKIVLFLHDYKVVCPIYSLLSNQSICEKCSNKKFYFCTLKKCKENSVLKSMILTLDSYYNNAFHDAYKHVDLIISPSHFLKRKVREMGFKYDIVVLHHPIEQNKSFAENTFKKKDILLFVGRLSEEKGIYLLMELAKRLNNVEIHIIGDGVLRTVVLNRLEKLKNVTYHGYQQQDAIRSFMKKAKYLIVPSTWYEVYGMVILEAMSMGLPVIASKKGGIPELIGETRGACLAFDSIEESAKLIKRMMEIDDIKYSKMSQEALLFARNKNYSNYYSELSKFLSFEEPQ